MAGRRIIWAPDAQQQFNEIVRFYNNRNKSKVYSRKLRRLLQEKIRLLQEQPYLGTRLNDTDRVLFISHYHLFYEATNDSLNIHGIWDGRRDPESIKYYKKS